MSHIVLTYHCISLSAQMQPERERERDNRIKVYIYDAPARFARIGAEHFEHTHTH